MSCWINKRSPGFLLSNLLLIFYLIFYSVQAWAPFNRFGNSLRHSNLYMLVSVLRNGANQPIAWVATNQPIHPEASPPADNILSHHISPHPQWVSTQLPLNECPHLNENIWQQLPLGSILTPIDNNGILQQAYHQVEIDTSTPTTPDGQVLTGAIEAFGQLDLQLIQQNSELCSLEAPEVTITRPPSTGRQPVAHSFFDLVLQLLGQLLPNPQPAGISADEIITDGELILHRPKAFRPTPYLTRNSRSEYPRDNGAYVRLDGYKNNIASQHVSFVAPPAMTSVEVTGIHNHISGQTRINATPPPGGSWFCTFMQITRGTGNDYVVVGGSEKGGIYALVPMRLALGQFHWIINPRSCQQEARKDTDWNPDDHQPPPNGGVH